MGYKLQFYIKDKNIYLVANEDSGILEIQLPKVQEKHGIYSELTI
jgi:hypothetical protein